MAGQIDVQCVDTSEVSDQNASLSPGRLGSLMFEVKIIRTGSRHAK
jgi:hypothetical protein